MKSGSRLERILTAGQFAVTGELGPPKSADPEVVRAKARILKGHVDAVNITDCQTAIVRMSSIAAGLLVLNEGVEPVIQMTCRDRNRIGMQSDVLGAAALGLKNLLCLTGDHQKFGNHPGAKGVFDMDSIQLLGMIKGMRDNRKFQCGEDIKSAEPHLFLGAAANPFAGPFEFRAARLGKKVSNGADFIQTQIVYNVEKFARFMEMVRDLGLDQKVFLLAGVTPPKSLGMARYMKQFVPGLEVSDDVLKRMKDAKDKEDEGINICVDIINQVKEIKGVAGVHIMAIEWESAVPEIVKRAKLGPRPLFDDEQNRLEISQSAIIIREEGRAEGTESPIAKADAILTAARLEAEKIVKAARQQASLNLGQAVGETTAYDAGEDEMNERERQMALEAVRQGLNSLKKAFGLSDEQMDALAKFAGAEAILAREAAKTTQPISTTTPVPVAAPAALAPTKSADEEKKTLELKAAQDAKMAAEVKAQAEAKAAEEAKKLADVKAADDAKKAAQVKADEEAKKAAEAKSAAEAKKITAPKAVTQPAPTAKAAGIAATELKAESTPLQQRCSKIPADHYTTPYNGKIREIALGSGDQAVTVGGATTLPFQLFEGASLRKPLIAMDVLDVNPDEWPVSLSRYFEGVLDNPAAWAKKCVNEYAADAICLSLISTDPNGLNRPAAEAAKMAAQVVKDIDVPIIVWGGGNAEKDTETLRELTAIIGDKKICLAPLSDANYRSLGATGMAFGHSMVASSPIDVNLAKQLNILLENLGVPLSSVMIDPSIGALGYGIEYSYSVMERIRLAALTQKDEKLQVPFICNLGREVWKTKETRLPSDGILGDQENRGVLMEAVTATCMLVAGGEVLVMRHPRSIALVKSLIDGLTK